jgi:hypothetical protein
MFAMLSCNYFDHNNVCVYKGLDDLIIYLYIFQKTIYFGDLKRTSSSTNAHITNCQLILCYYIFQNHPCNVAS